MKVSDLNEAALDWAAAKCLGFKYIHVFKGDRVQVMVSNKKDSSYYFNPSDNWAQGGEIIEQEEISIKHVVPAMRDSIWQAFPSLTAKGAGGKWGVGPTPLVAAMRCYVATRLGEDIELPEELK
jgi:hypothetical protein